MKSASDDYTTPYKDSKTSARQSCRRPWEPFQIHEFVIHEFGDPVTKARIIKAKGIDAACLEFCEGRNGIVYVYVNGGRVPFEVDCDAKEVRIPRR